MPFHQVVPANPPETFIYADPPYSSTEAGYNAYWSDKDELLLEKYLRIHADNGGTFALSGVIGNPIIDHMIKDHPHIPLEHDYGKVARIKDRHLQEVLVTNYTILESKAKGLDRFL